MRRPVLVCALALAAGLGALVLVQLFGGPRDLPAIRGLPSPGAFTTWGLPIMRLVHDLCAVGTVGSLLAAVLLGEKDVVARAVPRWALAWAGSAAATVLLTLSDFVGAPVLEALRSGMLSTFVLYVPQGLSFLVVYVLALAIVLLSLVARGRPWVLLAVAVAAVLPPAYAGHSASAVDHDFAVSSLLVHLGGVVLWVGGLFGLLVFMRDAPVRAVERFSTLALWCYVTVALSGLLNAWVRLGRVELLWTSEYGVLVLLKLAAMGALGWFGLRHRTRTIAALTTTRRPFLRLAAGEVVLMAATMGLAVALSRTPPPPGESPAHGVLGFYLPILAPGRFVTEWRPDPILLLAVALACAAYFRWSDRRRPVMWAAGLALFAYATVGGLGTYARAMVSAQLVQWAIVGVLVPAMLAMAWRPWRPPAWVGLVTATVPSLALFTTPLFELSQSVQAVRLLVLLGLAVAAYTTLCSGIWPVMAGTQALVALYLLFGPDQGRGWYSQLGDITWLPVGDQWLGALIYAAIAAVAVATARLSPKKEDGHAASRDQTLDAADPRAGGDPRDLVGHRGR
ncbi:CopD family protein [Herbidospora sp. NBRC 101105]|uniref:CopD family protein n=1 Tax=Herbidospora sp. NBRC 101105 TaxID=3032195 RepID=UPI002555236F|nr:CopD family protein [Herbidospora sp. NBRC 101105]